MDTEIMDIDVWKHVQLIYKLADKLDELKLGAKLISKERTTKELIELEVQAYLLSMFAHNGGVGAEEIEFVNFYLDTEWQESAASKLVHDVLPSMEKFVEESPLCFVVTISENRMKGADSTFAGSMLNLYLKMLLEISFKAIEVDGNWENERFDFAVHYLNRLKQYILKNHLNAENIEALNEIPEEKKPDSDETEENIVGIDVEEGRNIDTLISELNSLVGLQEVKQDVASLINLLKIRRIREERGLTLPPISLHLVFSGNPGTGKTTVARLLAQIYKELGILSKGHLVEVDRSKLVGGYVGQTAIKVQDAIQSAIGGVLFIDEAYSLVNKGQNDYGTEAIDTLVKGMEDNRADLVVIVAGYPDLMEDFLNANPGLRSRFNKFLYFADYSAQERLEIFEKMAQKSGYDLTAQAADYAGGYFEKQCMNVDEANANARGVRNFFEKAIVNQANRLAETTEYLSNDDLMTIRASDLFGID